MNPKIDVLTENTLWERRPALWTWGLLDDHVLKQTMQQISYLASLRPLKGQCHEMDIFWKFRHFISTFCVCADAFPGLAHGGQINFGDLTPYLTYVGMLVVLAEWTCSTAIADLSVETWPFFWQRPHQPWLKVPKCEIFDPFFVTPINLIWVGVLRTGEKICLFEDYGRYSPFFFFLRRLSLR